MTQPFMLWVLAGIVVGLVYFPFFASIDSKVAGKLWGFPLLYLFTFFLWPITLLYIAWRHFAKQ